MLAYAAFFGFIALLLVMLAYAIGAPIYDGIQQLQSVLGNQA